MQEAKKTIDRRVIKTKRAIRNAFAKLLTQKDMNDITIKDITELADINRKTFYNYYNGIYQLVDEVENEVAEKVELLIADLDLRQSLNNPYEIFRKVTGLINTDMDFYGHLFTMRGHGNLGSKIVYRLKRKVKDSFTLQLDLDDKTADIVLEYLFSGMISVYRSWFASDRRRSIEEISGIIGTLSFNGINGMIEKK